MYPLTRPSVAELSRQALQHNLKTVRARIRSNAVLHRPDAEIMAVVKADAYGHDLNVMMPELLQQGVKHFAVASLGEAEAARKISKRPRLLVLGGTFDWTHYKADIIKKNKLEVAVSSIEGLKYFLHHPEIPIHLKLDTGMNRLGLKSDEWDTAISLLKKNERPLTGLMTHFASASKSSFRMQAMLFEEATRWFFQAGVRPKFVHAENSAALFSKPPIKKGFLAEVGRLVRPGVSIYGYNNPELRSRPKLKPVLELISDVGVVKRVERGEGVSYEHLYVAPKAHDYAVVPIGYADGVAKAYSPYIKPEWRTKSGKRKGSLSILGAICMDMIMVKASRGKLAPGDKVALWGRFANPMLSHAVVGPYELNLRIAKRIPRIWVK